MERFEKFVKALSLLMIGIYSSISLTSCVDKGSTDISKKMAPYDYHVLHKLEYIEKDIVYNLFDSKSDYIPQLTIDENIKRGQANNSARWENLDINTSFTIESKIDFCKYDKFGMWVYSEKATLSSITIRIFCQPSLGFEKEIAYYYKTWC